MGSLSTISDYNFSARGEAQGNGRQKETTWDTRSLFSLPPMPPACPTRALLPACNMGARSVLMLAYVNLGMLLPHTLHKASRLWR